MNDFRFKQPFNELRFAKLCFLFGMVFVRVIQSIGEPLCDTPSKIKENEWFSCRLYCLKKTLLHKPKCSMYIHFLTNLEKCPFTMLVKT